MISINHAWSVWSEREFSGLWWCHMLQGYKRHWHVQIENDKPHDGSARPGSGSLQTLETCLFVIGNQSPSPPPSALLSINAIYCIVNVENVQGSICCRHSRAFNLSRKWAQFESRSQADLEPTRLDWVLELMCRESGSFRLQHDKQEEAAGPCEGWWGGAHSSDLWIPALSRNSWGRDSFGNGSCYWDSKLKGLSIKILCWQRIGIMIM